MYCTLNINVYTYIVRGHKVRGHFLFVFKLMAFHENTVDLLLNGLIERRDCSLTMIGR